MWIRLLIVLIILSAINRFLSWRYTADPEGKPTAADGTAATTGEAKPEDKAAGGEDATPPEKAGAQEAVAIAIPVKVEAPGAKKAEKQKQVEESKRELDEAQKELEAAERELAEIEKQRGSGAA